MDWQDLLAWILQIVAATAAIWGLYSDDTSKQDPTTNKKSLTVRGWLALAGVVLGIMAFGLNQWRDHVKSRRAEERAMRAETTLAEVRESQTSLVTEQGKQLGLLKEQTVTQQTQIGFLSRLALVQQQVAALELSWPVSATMQGRISSAMSRFEPPARSLSSTQDAYLDACLRGGEFVLVRRPNYSWRIDCMLSRPQGTISPSFEIPAGEIRSQLVDVFLDALLSPPEFVFKTDAGDEILSFSTANRPANQRRGGKYVLRHNELRARLSTLKDAQGEFRMQFSSAAGLPDTIRIRSLDPLLRLDTSWRMNWRQKETGVVRTAYDAGDELVDVKEYVMTSVRNPLRAELNKLLLPDGK